MSWWVDRMSKKYGLSWKGELRHAATRDDFETLKERIPEKATDVEIFTNITTPEVLDACLQHLQPVLWRCCCIFYLVAMDLKVELLDVFFAGSFLTPQGLLQTVDDEMRHFTFITETVVKKGAVDVFNFFVEKDIPVVTASHPEAFFTACARGKIDILDIMLARGVDVNLENKSGETAVFNAMWSLDITVLHRLYLHGANFFHRDKNGKNAWSSLYWACYQKPKEKSFQYLADMKVPLEREVYDEYFSRFSASGDAEGVLRIMRETLIKQGDLIPEEEAAPKAEN